MKYLLPASFVVGAVALTGSMFNANLEVLGQAKQESTTATAKGTGEALQTGEESLFAEIAPDGTVIRVLVISETVVNSGAFGDPKNWVRTYQSGRGREAYAGKGDKYDAQRDIFTAADGSSKILPPDPIKDTTPSTTPKEK